MSANDEQVGGTHYKTEYQHWDFVRDVGMNYMEAQVVRYLRHKDNRVEDLNKALHFVGKMQEERNKAVESTLEKYASANNLTAGEYGVVEALVKGDLAACEWWLKEILESENNG